MNVLMTSTKKLSVSNIHKESMNVSNISMISTVTMSVSTAFNKESVKDHRYLLFFLNLGLFCEQRQHDDDDDDEVSWLETLKTHILLPFRHEM